MWFILECCGIACVIITYMVLATVEFGFLFIGIADKLELDDQWGKIHFVIFNVNMFLIISSHIRCMITEPGCLPKNYTTLNPKKLPAEVKEMLMAIEVKEEEDPEYLKTLKIEQLDAIQFRMKLQDSIRV